MEAGFLDVNLEEVDIENSVSIPTSMWMRQGVVESIYMDGLKDSVRYSSGATKHRVSHPGAKAMQAAIRVVGSNRGELKRDRMVAKLETPQEVSEWSHAVGDGTIVPLDRNTNVQMQLPLVVEYHTKSHRTSVSTSRGGVERTNNAVAHRNSDGTLVEDTFVSMDL